MDNKPPPPDSGSDLPPDLADDLLDTPTKTILRAPSAPEVVSANDSAERFQNAKILFNERMWDEAKRLLHENLVADPHHLPSRELLEKIRRGELQAIISDESPPAARTGPAEESRDQVQESLERELGLDADPLERLSLMEDFFSNLDELSRELGPSDLLDLGASFLAAGLYGSAIRVLEKAFTIPETPLQQRSAALLLAQAQIHAEHPSLAVAYLEGVLQDTELPRADKLDFFYWMARAQLALGERPEAARWLQLVRQLSPRHRDSEELARGLEEG